MTFPVNPQIVHEVSVSHVDCDDYMLTVSNYARIANWKAISDACEVRGWKTSTFSTLVYPLGLARIEGVRTLGGLDEDELKALANALAGLKIAIEAEMVILPEDVIFKK